MGDEVRRAVRGLHFRAWIVIGALLVGIALDSALGLATVSQIGLLHSIASGVHFPPDVIHGNDARMGLLNSLKLSSYYITGILFCVWMIKARHNLPLLGAQGLEYAPWWAVVGFLIPFLSLVRPYQVMSEIWTGSDPNREGAQSWRWRNPPARLLCWWLLFLAMCLGSGILTVMASDKTGPVIPRLISHSYFGIGKSLMDIVAALAAILVIQSVSAQQDAGLERLITPPQAPAVIGE